MFVAFTAGLASFLSPCVLPLIPGYISFISGVSVADMVSGDYQPAFFDKKHLLVLINAALFVAGFSIVFILLGASATWIGSQVTARMGLLTKISGAVIILFGLVKAGVFKISWFMKDTRFQLDTGKKGPFFSLALGMAFAFGWTPCTGPVLGAILTFAGTADQVNSGILLLVIYSAGLGIPFLLTAFFIQYFFRFFNRIKKHLGLIEKATGLVLIIMGVMIFTDSFYLVSGWFSFFNRFTL